MFKKCFILLLLVMGATLVHAQGDEIAREAAISAAQAKLGTRPLSWTYEILTQTNNSSLGCPLVATGDLGRQVVPYRYDLVYTSGTYVVYASSDGTVVVLCDSKFTQAATAIPASTPVATVLGATPAPIPTGINVGTACYLVSSGAFANVRETPNLNAKQVGQIFSGQTYEAVFKNSNASDVWYWIVGGWVSGSAVTLSGTCGTLGINDGLIGTGSGLTVPSANADLAQTLLNYACPPTFDGYLTPTIKVGEKTAKVQAGGIPNTLRTQPVANDQLGARVGTIQPNRTLDRVINGPACSGGIVWWLVEIDGTQGWTAESNFADDTYYLEPTPGNEVTRAVEPLESITVAGQALIANRDDLVLSGKVAFNTDNTTMLASGTITDANGLETYVVAEYDSTTLSVTDAGMAVPGAVTRLQVLPDGTVVVGDESNTITFFKKDGGQYQQLSVIPNVVNIPSTQTFTVADDGKFLAQYACVAVAPDCAPTLLVLRSVENANPIWQISLAQTHLPQKILFSPDGQTIVSFGADGAYLFDRATGIQVGFISNATVGVSFMLDFAFNPTTSTLAITTICQVVNADNQCDLGEVTLWDVTSSQAVGVISFPSIAPFIVEYTDGGKFILLGESGGTMSVLDGATGGLVARYAFPDAGESLSSVADVAVSPDGRYVLAMSSSALRPGDLTLIDLSVLKQ